MIALLPKEKVVPLVKGLSQSLEVIAPIMMEGQPAFSTWKGQELALDADNPLSSPVEFLLPKREVLFRYIQYSGRYTFEETPPVPRLILGVRPCDMRAISVLDRIYGEEPRDEAYLSRRRSTIIVVINCASPGEGCLCAQMGSGPQCLEGYDLLLTDLGESYLAESGSPAGILLLKEHAELFEEAGTPHLAEKRKILSLAERQVLQARPALSPERMKEIISSAPWEELGERCLRCAGCSFVCPTCHCFNILDLGVPDGERIRCADSCTLSGFSRMTSGANPRASQGERLRNWYLDKFQYIPERTGLLGCVGCGRCNRVCLSEMDRWSLEVI